MKQYPDAKEHYSKHVPPLIDRYVDRLQRSGLEATPTLQKALVQRAQREAEEAYQEELAKVLLHNLACIDDAYRRKNLRQQQLVFSLLCLVMVGMVVYSFMQPGVWGVVLGVCCVCVALFRLVTCRKGA